MQCSLGPFRDNFIQVYWRESKCGFKVNDSYYGSRDIPCIYESYTILTDETVALRLNERWGILNHKNQQICSFVYDRIEPYYGDQCLIMSKGKWGIINATTGNVLVVPMYDQISRIDIKTRLLRYLPGEFWGSRYSTYYSVRIAYQNGKAFLLSDSGMLMSPKGYDNIVALILDGTGDDSINIIVENNNKLGLLNKNGQVITRCEYDEIKQIEGYVNDDSTFFCNIAVRKDKKWGLLGRRGKVIFDCDFEDIKSVGSAIALKHNSKWGILPLKTILSLNK